MNINVDFRNDIITDHTKESVYCSVFISHEPPGDILLHAIKTLSSFKNMKVFVIDSSSSVKFSDINSAILSINSTKIGAPVEIFHVENMGTANKLNFGIKKCVETGCNIITFFEDDCSLIEKTFLIESITGFFLQHCDPKKDVLVLPVLNEDKFLPKGYNEIFDLGKVPGITFSSELATRIKFREDLVIDQVDIDFGRRVRKTGGKIIYYPEFAISRLPIGRETGNGIHALPYWRFYLYVRNVFLLALEERVVLSRMEQLTYAALGSAHWLYNGMKSGQNVAELVRILRLGIIDAAMKRSGITENLQILSGNRFSTSNSMRTCSSREISDSSS